MLTPVVIYKSNCNEKGNKMDYYYPEEYVMDKSVYCSNCDKEFDTEVEVKGNYYEINCPDCNKVISGYAE